MCRPGQPPTLGRVPDQYHSPDSVTAQVLEAAAARLTGNNYVDAQSCFVSASTPIAARIPIKVKEQIWANQFIEFHELRSPNPWETSTAEIEQHTCQEPVADKAARQQNTKREPLTLAQWTTAWNRFTAVLTEQKREETGLTTMWRSGATWPRTKPAGVRPTSRFSCLPCSWHTVRALAAPL